MSSIENSIIQSKIINQKKFVLDIVWIALLELGFVGLFFSYRYFEKIQDLGTRDIILSLFSIFIILSLIYCFKRILKLLKLSQQKELGTQMQKKAIIITVLHVNALISGVILFFMK